MRKIVVAVALLFAVTSQSQQPSQQKAQPTPVAAPAPLVEKIDVSVVNVDVTVTDRRGQPVPGLTRNDFEILEDGKLQPISNFYAVENAQAKADTQSAESAPAPPADRFRRKVLVLVDNLNSTMHGRNDALAKLETFIKDHFDDGRYDWSIAIVDSRVHLVLPMTSDKKVLHDVVAAIRHSPTRNEMKATISKIEFDRVRDLSTNQAELSNPNATEAQARVSRFNFNEESDLTEQTMFAESSTGAIVQAARAFGMSEGRKIILLVTGQLPLGQVSPIDRIGGDNSSKLGNHIGTLTTADRELSDMRQELVHEANASNTSFYIIAADGLEAPEQEALDKNFGAPRARSNSSDTSPMFWLAKETGGAYMPGNRIDQSLIDFDRRSASFYSLGYMPLHIDDNTYHHLTVHVKKHRDYQLQYRDGYSSTPTDMQMTRALRSPLGAVMQPSTMAVSLIFGEPQYRGIIALVPIKAAMSMESLQYITDARGSRTRLHVYVSIFDPDGRNITLAKSYADISVQPNESATGPMTVTIPPLALAKGSYRVVVAVRDELTDHVGVVSRKIEI
ncbi:MAG TPA: VWA domain-containing protein [Thermoanaerobaculia bacterium]